MNEFVEGFVQTAFAVLIGSVAFYLGARLFEVHQAAAAASTAGGA